MNALSGLGKNTWAASLLRRSPLLALLCKNAAQVSYSTSPSFTIDQSRIRNIAIIAHVDHGKTTLVDCLLKQSGSLSEALEHPSASGDMVRVMDSNVLERERGITILSKVTSIQYNGHRVNIVDTPGHADFGGEVERVLTMVDGVALVVDATEGPMAQTKFVLSKALRRGLLPIVVMNKIDRPTSRPDQVDSDLLDLFCMLEANDKQLAYPMLYASAKEGWATLTNPHPLLKETTSPEQKGLLLREEIFKGRAPSMEDLFHAIIRHVPPPSGDRSKPFSLLVNNIENNTYVGKCFLGKIETGHLRINDKIKSLLPDPDSHSTPVRTTDEGRVVKMFVRQGLQQVPIEEAAAGDIISIAGIQNSSVNSTICAMEVGQCIQGVAIDPPTISMMFSPNTSPISGTEGRAATTQMIGERLKKETETNVALGVVPKGESFEVFGRGELQLGILIETMRREGIEFSISPPRVILKTDPDLVNDRSPPHPSRMLEPMEELTVDVDEEYSGSVIQKLTLRKGELIKVSEAQGKARLVFRIPTRGMIGYHAEFKNDTHGTGIINHSFVGFEKYKGKLEFSRKGTMISMASGITTPFALKDLEPRGVLFIGPGKLVYPGMVIGESSRPMDHEVNPVKEKQVSNYRAAAKDGMNRLALPKVMSLEECIAYVADDEMIEVTPKSVRLRKKILDSNERKRKSKSAMSTY